MAYNNPLVPRHIFGLNGKTKDNVHFISEHHVVYPAANNIVIYDMELKTQKFIQLTPESKGVSSLALCRNRKYLAVAEILEDPLITIYDLATHKKRKTLQTKQYGSPEVVSMSFSHDSKFLACQGGSPEWNMCLWVWEKSKVASSLKTNDNDNVVYQVAFNPYDQSVLTVCGHNLFKSFRLVDIHFKPLTPYLGKGKQPGDCTAHGWLPPDSNDRERVIIGTSHGDLFFCESGELKCSLAPPAAYTTSIECLVAYSKGFICGSDHGLVTLYERLEDAPYFKKNKTFKVFDNLVKIKSISLSPSEETLVCTLENNQAFAFPLNQADILDEGSMVFEYLSHPVHSSAITGISTCVRKPLMATSSTDQTVRIWNYLERSCVLVKHFTEEVHSVTLHPSGIHVAVGFSDKLRVMNILDNDIRAYAEFPVKVCQCVVFSNGGHMFAAANGNTVQVYTSYTCENIGTLRGHNGKVRSLFFSKDDTRLVSAGADGAVYEWSMHDMKRLQENVLKGCSYSAVITNMEEPSKIYAAGSDRKIKEMTDAVITREVDVEGAQISQLRLSGNQKMLFAATEAGSVRLYRYPLTGDFAELQSHYSPITQIACTTDDSMLFSVSEDGCVVMMDVRDKDVHKATVKKEGAAALTGALNSFSDDILVCKSELEERKTKMADLETAVAELASSSAYQLHLKDLALEERIKALTDDFNKQLEQERGNYGNAMLEKASIEQAVEERMRALNVDHRNALSQLESQFQQKIVGEVERYQVLVSEKEVLDKRWDQQNSMLMDSHERVIHELTEEYEDKLMEGNVALSKLQSLGGEQTREFEETKFQLEEDADREIEQQKMRYEARLTHEREMSLRLKGENGIMKKKFNVLQRDIATQADDIKSLEHQKKGLYEVIAGLEKEIAALKMDISERDESIGDKERRIFDMKKKMQELEKFKFVLDFKITELRKQIEPREVELSRMKEVIGNMDGELSRYRVTQVSLEGKIGDLKNRLEAEAREVLVQRGKNNHLRTHIGRMNHAMLKVVDKIQAPNELKQAVTKFYQQYNRDDLIAAELAPEIETEYRKQKEFLERSVDGLKKKLDVDVEVRKTDNRRTTQENVTLLKEINEMRREIKVLQDKNMAQSLDFKNKEVDLKRMEMRRSLQEAGMGGPTFQRPRMKERPLSEQFGTAPRWGEPRLPPRPFTGAPPVMQRSEMDKNMEIARLTHTVSELEARLRQVEHVHTERPASGRKLPPMDGFSPPRPPKTAPPYDFPVQT